MPEEYLREQLWKLYQKLPEELQETIFSAETADHINGVCTRNNVTEEKIPEVAKYTGRVLMGLLPPNELEKTLVKKVELKNEMAKTVAREINRFVFFPVKEVLSQIYEMEIAPPARPPGVIKEKGKKPEIPLEEKPGTAPEEPEEEEPKRPDVYREEIE